MWQDDALFGSVDQNSLKELGNIATPAFRLSAQASRSEGHPFDHTEAYERLFNLFRPVLEKHAERLMMTDPATGKARRRQKITADDWQPFQFIRQNFDDRRNWIGFDFKSGVSGKIDDKGPTGFRFRLARTLQLDVTIPVSSFAAGEIDIDEMKAAMLALPVRSALAGYGLATSSFFDAYESPRPLLMPVAEKFPVVDLCPSPLRAWSADFDDDLSRAWLSGVNWLTLVGDPILAALGGPERLMEDLPSEVTAHVADRAVLFQLGAFPITGEKGRDDVLLPLYHALGRKLQPFGDGEPSSAFPRQPVFGWPEQSLAWDRRFYDGAWFDTDAT